MSDEFVIRFICHIFAGVTQLTLSGPTVSYAGGRATFTCSNGENTVSMQWLVNGTLFNSSSMNIISEFSQITRVGNLIFRDVLQYNGTTIQCSATSSSGRITHSNNITMLVQGWLINICYQHAHLWQWQWFTPLPLKFQYYNEIDIVTSYTTSLLLFLFLRASKEFLGIGTSSKGNFYIALFPGLPLPLVKLNKTSCFLSCVKFCEGERKAWERG